MIPWYGWVVIAAGCALPVVFAFLAPFLHYDDDEPTHLTEVTLRHESQTQQTDS